MPRPPRPWFRIWSELLDSAKLHNLNAARPDLIFPWLELLSLANITEPRGSLPKDVAKIAFALRENPQRTAEILSALQDYKLLDLKSGRYVMHDWKEWQPASDANLTPGRETRAHNTRKERRRNGVGTRNERETPAVGTRSGVAETEAETETETETEADAEDARPPEHPFAFMYAQKYRMREGRPIPPVVHAAALALEREFGSQACIDAAADFDWQKHPNYLKPGLEERRNGTASRPKTARNVSGRSAGGGAASGDFGLEDWKRYDADRPRSPAAATT